MTDKILIKKLVGPIFNPTHHSICVCLDVLAVGKVLVQKRSGKKLGFSVWSIPRRKLVCMVMYHTYYHHNQPVVSARNTQKMHPLKEPIMVSMRRGGNYTPEKTNPSRGGRKRGSGVSSGASAAAAAKKPSRGPRPGEEEEEDAVAAALEYTTPYGSGGDSNHEGLAWGVYDDDDGGGGGGGGGSGGGGGGGEEEKDEEEEEAEAEVEMGEEEVEEAEEAEMGEA